MPFIEESCYSVGCAVKHELGDEIRLLKNYSNYLEKIIKEYNVQVFNDKFDKLLKD